MIFINFLREEAGASSVEYAILAAIISIAAIATIAIIGRDVDAKFVETLRLIEQGQQSGS
ncbi:MAG: Flp family type IVb pilin [Moraxellaceae bacterium]